MGHRAPGDRGLDSCESTNPLWMQSPRRDTQAIRRCCPRWRGVRNGIASRIRSSTVETSRELRMSAAKLAFHHQRPLSDGTQRKTVVSRPIFSSARECQQKKTSFSQLFSPSPLKHSRDNVRSIGGSTAGASRWIFGCDLASGFGIPQQAEQNRDLRLPDEDGFRVNTQSGKSQDLRNQDSIKNCIRRFDSRSRLEE